MVEIADALVFIVELFGQCLSFKIGSFSPVWAIIVLTTTGIILKYVLRTVSGSAPTSDNTSGNGGSHDLNKNEIGNLGNVGGKA